MACQTNAQTNGPCPNWTFNTSTNHISTSGFTYDAAGNLTADGTGTGTHTYQWDAEGRLSSVDGGTTASFTYNALSQRAEMVEQGWRVEYPSGAAGEEMGLLNGGNGVWWHKYLPVGGAVRMHYTTISGVDYTRFLHTNALGSVGMVTVGERAGGGIVLPLGAAVGDGGLRRPAGVPASFCVDGSQGPPFLCDPSYLKYCRTPGAPHAQRPSRQRLRSNGVLGRNLGTF